MCPDRAWIALGFWLALAAGQTERAHAQATSATNDPGQIERRIRDRLLPAPPREAATPRVRTPAVASPEAVESLTLVLAAVVVDGATALPPDAFVPAYRAFLGRVVTSREIETIVARITRLYRDRGYFLATAVAPPQDLVGGVVRIRVIEGHVASVVFGGAGDREDDLRPCLAPVLAERPLRLATLERAVLLINDLPGIAAEASMRPIDEDEGRYSLTLAVDTADADGSVFVNNWGTDAVGPLQAWLSGGVNDTLGLGGRLQGGVFTVPNQPAELLYGEFAYVHPLGRDGTFVSAGGALAWIDEGDGSAVDSTSARVTLRGWHPLIRRQEQNLWLTGAFDYYNLDQQDDGETTAQDRLRVLRAGFNYWRADTLSGNTFLSGEISQGLPILGASRSNAADLTTDKGRSDFTKVTLTAAREQGLTKALGVQVSATAQTSLTRLLSAEQFGYGGSQFGPAYDFAELTGDDGAAAGVELRYGRDVGWRWLRAYQLFAGYDVGLVWNDGAGDTTVRDSLASLGGGIRLTFAEGVLGTLQFAHGLRAFDSTDGNGNGRVSFTVSADF